MMPVGRNKDCSRACYMKIECCPEEDPAYGD
jgi:hypothetical protein